MLFWRAIEMFKGNFYLNNGTASHGVMPHGIQQRTCFRTVESRYVRKMTIKGNVIGKHFKQE